MGALFGRLLLAGICKGPRGPRRLPDSSRVDELCPGRGQSFHLHFLQPGAPALLQHHAPVLQKIQVTKGTLLRYMKVSLCLFFFFSHLCVYPWLIWAYSHCTERSFSFIYFLFILQFFPPAPPPASLFFFSAIEGEITRFHRCQLNTKRRRLKGMGCVELLLGLF